MNERQKRRGGLQFEILNERTLRAQNRVLRILEASDGRASREEIAKVIELQENEEGVHRELPLAPLQNRCVTISHVMREINWEIVNYNRALLGKPAFLPIGYQKAYTRSKQVDDLVLIALEQLGGWATVTQISRRSGVAIPTVRVIIDRLDFDNLNQWRAQDGLFPLGVLNIFIGRSSWWGKDLYKLQRKTINSKNLREIFKDTRAYFRSEAPGQSNIFNVRFGRLTYPLLCYLVRENFGDRVNGNMEEKAFALIQEALTVIVTVALDRDLTGKKLIDYFSFTVPRAMNTRRDLLDPLSIEEDPNDRDVFTQSLKARGAGFRAYLYQSFDGSKIKRGSDSYSSGLENNALRYMGRMVPCTASELVPAMLPGPSKDRVVYLSRKTVWFKYGLITGAPAEPVIMSASANPRRRSNHVETARA